MQEKLYNTYLLGLKRMANFTIWIYPESNLSRYPTDSDITIIICQKSIIILPMNRHFLHNTSRHSIHMMIASVVMRIWKQ